MPVPISRTRPPGRTAAARVMIARPIPGSEESSKPASAARSAASRTLSGRLLEANSNNLRPFPVSVGPRNSRPSLLGGWNVSHNDIGGSEEPPMQVAR